MLREQPPLMPHLHAAVEACHAVVIAPLVGYTPAGILGHVHDVLYGELAAHLSEKGQMRGYPAGDLRGSFGERRFRESDAQFFPCKLELLQGSAIIGDIPGRVASGKEQEPVEVVASLHTGHLFRDVFEDEGCCHVIPAIEQLYGLPFAQKTCGLQWVVYRDYLPRAVLIDYPIARQIALDHLLVDNLDAARVGCQGGAEAHRGSTTRGIKDRKS